MLSRSRPGTLPSPDVLVAAHKIAFARHTLVYDEAIARGTTSERAALCPRAHAVWEDIAPDCGLRYTRVETEVALWRSP